MDACHKRSEIGTRSSDSHMNATTSLMNRRRRRYQQLLGGFGTVLGGYATDEKYVESKVRLLVVNFRMVASNHAGLFHALDSVSDGAGRNTDFLAHRLCCRLPGVLLEEMKDASGNLLEVHTIRDTR